ncbi:MAG: CRTAC1 family protein [Polyangiaceae bacterium]
MQQKWPFYLLAALAGCGGAETSSSAGGATTTTSQGGAGAGGATAGGGAGGAPVCGTANRALPEGLVDLSWDDGAGVSDVREQSWKITVNNNDYALADGPLHESVRFELPHPAKIYGFAIEWAPLPDGTDPMTELAAGLYPDFGYNGFDFWEKDPLFVGTRCAADAKPGELLPYVFEAPIPIEQPGLVYVAHLMSAADDPVMMFDGSEVGDGTCAHWDDCHSAMNLPAAETKDFYNGVSFPFQRDFRVHLYVEYTDDVAPADHIFQPPAAPGPGPSGHVAFGDYDNDGFDDMITEGPTLWHNAAGVFTDVTETSGIKATGASATGGVFGDYDNDGCLDLFLYAESYVAKDTLLHSRCDGTFEDATAAAGIADVQVLSPCGADPANVSSPAAAAAWMDIDADGKLDLYVANFLCWDTYGYYIDAVWHNLGNGTFEDWTGKHGFGTKKTPSRGAAPVDYDGDGDVDLFINNYVLQPNLLFVNNGDGTVTETAKSLGAAGLGTTGYTFGHTIGAAWGDLDNDGDFDLVAANLAHPRFYDFSDKTQILIQDATHHFADTTGDWAYPASKAGLRYQETHSVPALADFNHDGDLDMVITAVYDGRPTDFYWGKGDGTFELDAYHAGITTENGWGVSLSDVDNDGDVDIFATTLFVNTGKAKIGHWAEVRVIGDVASNWAAIGATVKLNFGAVSRIRHVEGGSGKGGQDSMYLHFGLAAEPQIASIEVTFPGGEKKMYPGPFAADQRIWVYESGFVGFGWSPPK